MEPMGLPRSMESMGLPRSMGFHGRHRGHGISMPAMAPMEFNARDGAYSISHARDVVNIYAYIYTCTVGPSGDPKPLRESLARCSAKFIRSLAGLLLI